MSKVTFHHYKPATLSIRDVVIDGLSRRQKSIIEDHMALVQKTAVALSYVVHSATHLRIVAEQFKAVGEGLKIGFGSLDTEVEHGAGQYSPDVIGSRFGKLIHRDRAGP